MKTTVRAAKKIIIFIAGVIVILCGIVLLVIPGPGLLVMFVGLLILSLEFEWAKKWRDEAKKRLREMNDKVRQQRQKKDSAKDIDRPRNDKRQRKN
ncbi:MAG TPA: PGPGW domain-containing protein [Candidatus Saccharimonadales bacterium]|nr:PGPGW domain-containing protein [Candidatus Saccharimonadales bacterium]